MFENLHGQLCGHGQLVLILLNVTLEMMDSACSPKALAPALCAHCPWGPQEEEVR